METAKEYEFNPISETEYLEEVPEGATVLVETEGEIKRVPGSGLGGGIKTAIIKSSDYDNVLSGIQPAVAAAPVTYECLNMTFEEAYQTVMNGEPIIVHVMNAWDGDVGQYQANIWSIKNSHYIDGLCIDDSIYWTADGISTEAPEMPK